jgi:hypothetical protein
VPSLIVVRWGLLALGIAALLATTVLYGVLVRRPLNAWLRLAERSTGAPVRLPRPLGVVLDSEALLRAWHGLWAVLFLALWWYLGTASGAAHWAALTS